MSGEMIRNREGFLVGPEFRQCTNKECLSIFKITSTVTLCPACNTNRVKSSSEEKKMLSRARSRATAQGLPFNIIVEDIVIPEVCPILGIKLIHHRGRSGAFKNSPSLDKIIPEHGYVRGNVVVISQLANQCKGAASPEELVAFAKWVFATYPDLISDEIVIQ